MLAIGAASAGAGAADSAAVRGYIVPTPNNPDAPAASTCAATFTDNYQGDDQEQSPAGTLANAVTLAGCSYDTVPFGGPSTEDRPVAFQVVSGDGGLICPGQTAQSQVCALPGINAVAQGEYRVQANSEAGVDEPGTLLVEFCADDPPAQGFCAAEDEQATQFSIRWQAAGGGGGQKCMGAVATIVAKKKKTNGTGGADVIVGRNGKDKIKGKGGDDLICGKGGKDKVKGGPGNDRLHGGAGKDRCKGGPGKDSLKACEKGSD